MFGPLLLLGAIQSDPLVSLEATARPLAEVLETLSAKSGVKHAAAPSHAKEVIMIRFKDRPLSEVRRKLGWSLDATWTETASGWTLERTPLRTKEIEAESLAVLKKEAAELLARVDERIKAGGTPYERIQKAAKAEHKGNLDLPWQQGPAGHWLLKIWKELGTEAIAASPAEGMVTYSDQPNANQKPLPPAAISMLASMHDELIQLNQETPRVTIHSNFGKRPMKTLIKLFRTGSTYRVWLTAYGSSGEMLYNCGYGGHDLGLNPYSRANELGTRVAAETFDLSPLSAELEKVREPHAEIFRPGEAPTPIKASQELIQKFINPETTDPLAYWNVEALSKWAGDKSICVVLPDRLDFASRSCLSPGKFQLGKFKAVAESVGLLKHVVEPNWFLGKAVNSPASEKTRFNRRALGNFLRDSYARKEETFESYARYMWEAGDPVKFFGFWTTYRRTMARLGVKPYALAESHPHEVWALIGSFNQPIDQLKAGKLITYGQATPAQRALMMNLARGSGMIEKEPGTQVRDIQLEPTEWMEPTTLQGATFAVVGATDIAVRREQTSVPTGYVEPPRSAEELGRGLAYLPTLDLTNFGTVVMGPRHRLLVQFKPIAELKIADSFLMGFEPSKPFKPADLPTDFVRALEEGYRAARKANGSGD